MTSISHALGWVVVGCGMFYVARTPPRIPVIDAVAIGIGTVSFILAAITFWSAP